MLWVRSFSKKCYSSKCTNHNCGKWWNRIRKFPVWYKVPVKCSILRTHPKITDKVLGNPIHLVPGKQSYCILSQPYSLKLSHSGLSAIKGIALLSIHHLCCSVKPILYSIPNLQEKSFSSRRIHPQTTPTSLGSLTTDWVPGRPEVQNIYGTSYRFFNTANTVLRDI